MIGCPVIDGDGHVTETEEAYRARLPEPYRSARPLYSHDGWDRGLGNRMGHRVTEPTRQLADMDQEGIDIAVLFPTLGLGIGNVRDPDLAIALARAYNDWLADFCAAAPDRLKGVGIVALQEPDAAVAELERLAALGLVSVQVPTWIAWRKLSDRALDPFWAAAERLDVPLGLHTQPRDAAGTDRFDKFLAVHAVAHPFEMMIAMAQLIFGGVLERFPALRVGFMEAGVGWVPYWMDRLDEEWEKRGDVEAPLCPRKPSEYVRSGRCYFGVECEELTIPDAIRHLGDRCLLYSSDNPHWDADWPHSVAKLRARDDLGDAAKRRILCDNAAAFYNLPVRELTTQPA
jgi:uncharacterized protein